MSLEKWIPASRCTGLVEDGGEVFTGDTVRAEHFALRNAFEAVKDCRHSMRWSRNQTIRLCERIVAINRCPYCECALDWFTSYKPALESDACRFQWRSVM